MKTRVRPIHLVGIVLTATLCVALVPVGVNAASTVMVLADRDNSSSKAKVSSKGSVWVIENDPYTGKYARVSADGKRLVGDGDGALTVDMTAPKTPWNQINDIQISGTTPRAVLYTGLGPAKLNITSFTVSAEGSTAGTVRAFVIVYVSDTNLGNCLNLTGASFGAAERFVVTVPVGQTVNLTYPTPLVFSAYAGANRRYCVDVEGTGPSGYVGHISASGFITP